MTTSDTFILTFTHLRDKPNADRALEMLKRTASLVKPIMRKHGWVLPVLAEFFPDNPNLLGLNVNMGQQILVRLRPPDSPDTFLEQEDVLQTMLHELTHNVHGPHDDKFYKFLSGLQDEYDNLKRSGYAGEGFFSKGKRLGTNISHDVPPHLARLRAIEAAEKRIKNNKVLGGGGKKVGGSNTLRSSPRELAAQAAERRLRDAKTCGSQFGSAAADREAAKAAQEGISNNVIDLTMDDNELWEPDWESDSDEVIIVRDIHTPIAGPSKPRTVSSSKTDDSFTNDKAKSSNAKSRRNDRNGVRVAKPLAISTPLQASPAHDEWACHACTLINKAIALQCEACTMRRPVKDVQKMGWSCLACGENGMPHEFWTCRFCGTVKVQS